MLLKVAVFLLVNQFLTKSTDSCQNIQIRIKKFESSRDFLKIENIFKDYFPITEGYENFRYLSVNETDIITRIILKRDNGKIIRLISTIKIFKKLENAQKSLLNNQKIFEITHVDFLVNSWEVIYNAIKYYDEESSNNAYKCLIEHITEYIFFYCKYLGDINTKIFSNNRIYEHQIYWLSLNKSEFFRTIDRVNYSAENCALRIDPNKKFRDMYKKYIKEDNDEILRVLKGNSQYLKDKISDMRIYLKFYVSWVLSDDEISNKKKIEIFDEICNLIDDKVNRLLEIEICDNYTVTQKKIDETEKEIIDEDNDKNREEEQNIIREIDNENENEIVDEDDSIENNEVDENNGKLDEEEIDEIETKVTDDDKYKNKEEESAITAEVEIKNENKDSVNNLGADKVENTNNRKNKIIIMIIIIIMAMILLIAIVASIIYTKKGNTTFNQKLLKTTVANSHLICNEIPVEEYEVERA